MVKLERDGRGRERGRDRNILSVISMRARGEGRGERGV